MGPKSSAESSDGLFISAMASIRLRLLTWALPSSLLCVWLDELEPHALLLLSYIFFSNKAIIRIVLGFLPKVTSSSQIIREIFLPFLKPKPPDFLEHKLHPWMSTGHFKTLKRAFAALKVFANLTSYLLWMNVVALQESQTKWIMFI